MKIAILMLCLMGRDNQSIGAKFDAPWLDMTADLMDVAK